MYYIITEIKNSKIRGGVIRIKEWKPSNVKVKSIPDSEVKLSYTPGSRLMSDSRPLYVNSVETISLSNSIYVLNYDSWSKMMTKVLTNWNRKFLLYWSLLEQTRRGNRDLTGVEDLINAYNEETVKPYERINFNSGLLSLFIATKFNIFLLPLAQAMVKFMFDLDFDPEILMHLPNNAVEVNWQDLCNEVSLVCIETGKAIPPELIEALELQAKTYSYEELREQWDIFKPSRYTFCNNYNISSNSLHSWLIGRDNKDISNRVSRYVKKAHKFIDYPNYHSEVDIDDLSYSELRTLFLHYWNGPQEEFCYKYEIDILDFALFMHGLNGTLHKTIRRYLKEIIPKSSI